MDQGALAERVADVVRTAAEGSQSDCVGRNQITVQLAADGELSPGEVDRGIEAALDAGLIEERAEGFVLAE